MRKIIRKVLKKKVNGSIGEWIIVIIVMAVIASMVLYAAAACSDLILKSDIDEIGRKYIFQIEANGNLNDQEVADKENDIKDEILELLGERVDASSINIDIQPNTYGNEVSLSISFGVKLKQSRFESVTTILNIKDVEYTKYSNTFCSTSKS